MKSIADLDEDPETGLAGFKLASKITGRSVKALYKATNPDPPPPDPEDDTARAPIYYDDVLKIDDYAAEHGKRAVNLEAWEERYAAKITGIDNADPDPTRLIDRSISNLSDAVEMIRNGAGDLGMLRSRFVAVSDLTAELTRAFVERDRRRDIRPEMRSTPGKDPDAEHEDRIRLVMGTSR